MTSSKLRPFWVSKKMPADPLNAEMLGNYGAKATVAKQVQCSRIRSQSIHFQKVFRDLGWSRPGIHSWKSRLTIVPRKHSTLRMGEIPMQCPASRKHLRNGNFCFHFQSRPAG